MKKFNKKSLEIKDFEVAKIEDCTNVKGCMQAGCAKSDHCFETKNGGPEMPAGHLCG